MNEEELRNLAGEDPRLRGAHEALIAAGRPPDVPPGRAKPPWHRGRAITRRRLAAAVAVAVLVAASLAAGHLIGARGDQEPFPIAAVVEMHPRESGTRASASIEVGEPDDAGNWPMTMTVQGLPVLPAGEQYELVLTRAGATAASCGFFVVEGESTEVFLNAPYRLSDFDGWAVTRAGDDEFLLVTDRL